MIHRRRARGLLARVARGDAGAHLTHSWPPAATRGLLAVLRGTSSLERRVQAAYSLAFLFDRRAFGPFFEVARNPAVDPLLRGECLEGIAYLVSNEDGREWPARHTHRARETERRLIALLDDPSSEVRFQAIFALGLGGFKRATPALKAVTGDASRGPFGWTVGAEAQDVLAYFETGKWPDHDPGSPRG